MLVLAAATSIPVRQARYTRQQFYCNFVTCNVRTSAGLEVLGASVDSMQLPWAKMQVSFCMTLRVTQEDCTERARGDGQSARMQWERRVDQRYRDGHAKF
jgi:hypothetical protein